MSRRRKKNPLLGRILAVVLVAHAIALPIAAHFGAFEKLKREFGTSKVVMVTVPPLEAEKKPPAKEEKKASKTQKTPKKGASAPTKSTSAGAKSNVPQPKVVAAAGGGAGGSEGGATVDPNGSGKAGQLPVEKTTGPAIGGTKTPPPPSEPPKKTEPTPKPPETKVEAPAPKPEPPPVTKPVEKPKRFTQVETLDAPEPTIPDELRAEPLDKTLVVEADVDTGGHPVNVKVVTPTGISQLDRIGLDTAKRYRFSPAKLGDDPVQGHVRFNIIFKVE